MPSANKPSPITLVPVILAGGSNLQTWPVSRIQAPVQFQQQRRALSRFQQALVCANRLTSQGCAEPVVSIPALSNATALRQIEQMVDAGLSNQPRVIVEPLDRGNWPAAIACALCMNMNDHAVLLAIINAANPPEDIPAFERLVYQMRTSALVAQSPVLCGEPALYDANSLQVQKSIATPDTLLHVCSRVQHDTDRPVFDIGGIAFIPLNTLLETNDSRTLETCGNAVQMAQTINGVVWLATNIWSNLQEASLFTQLADFETTLLRPVELGTNAGERRRDDDVFAENCENCRISSHGHLVAVAGATGLDIVATRDATLIADRNDKAARDRLLIRLRAAERPELFCPVQTLRDWGLETEMDRRNGLSVLKLDIERDGKIPPHLHNKRHETWQVIGGKGMAVVGSKECELAPGTLLTIPPETPHTCRNTGDEPLTLLEVRYGTYLGDTDMVAVDQTELQIS